MNGLRFLLILFCSVQVVYGDTADTFAAANDSYRKRDFGEAIKNYESLLRRGETRPEIYYNLGLAYEKSANPARATLSFERALLLAPGFADVHARLDTLGNPPDQWWAQLPRLGRDTSFIVAISSLWIVLFALVAYWRRLGNSKSVWSVTAVFGLLVFGIAGASFYLRDYVMASPQRAVVLKTEKLRSNFTANSPSILSLKPGQPVEITSVNGPWTQCRLPDQTVGWVATSSLERVIPKT